MGSRRHTLADSLIMRNFCASKALLAGLRCFNRSVYLHDSRGRSCLQRRRRSEEGGNLKQTTTERKFGMGIQEGRNWSDFPFQLSRKREKSLAKRVGLELISRGDCVEGRKLLFTDRTKKEERESFIGSHCKFRASNLIMIKALSAHRRVWQL